MRAPHRGALSRARHPRRGAWQRPRRCRVRLGARPDRRHQDPSSAASRCSARSIALLHRGPAGAGGHRPADPGASAGSAPPGRPTTFNGAPRPHAALRRAGARDALLDRAREHVPRRRRRGLRPAAAPRSSSRATGADCYAYAQLASGFIDLVVEARLKPYDYCALVPVIEGAGGAITDWQGEALGLASDGRVIACGDPARAAEARALLAGG